MNLDEQKTENQTSLAISRCHPNELTEHVVSTVLRFNLKIEYLNHR
jgi:hypothetical protein